MGTVSQKDYPIWINSEYEKSVQGEVKSLYKMIGAFTQSYQMLNTWKMQDPDDKNGYNKKNKLACATNWRDFCKDFKMNKGAVKVLLAVELVAAKQQLDNFAKMHSIAHFGVWLDDIDALANQLALPTDSRPFFSVVIACYNDGRYKEGTYLDRLLNSLCNQGLDRNELQVILSDDCSPVPFNDVVSKYQSKLDILRTKTDHNFAPGNTRQKGVELAAGRWLCFADHDDCFYPKALRAVRNFIIETNEQLYVYTPFNGIKPDGTIISKYEQTMGWCHGKFYNLDNFWKAKNIHFIHDLASHEDIAICTQVACALDTMKESTKSKYLPVVTYAWTNNPESVSHSKYSLEDEGGERNFLEVFFGDYIKSTGVIYNELTEKGEIPKNYGKIHALEVICYAYFYTQSFQFYRKDFLQENLAIAGRFLNRCKELYDLANNETVYNYVADNNGAMYRRIRPYADRGCYYIPQQGFKEWLDLIDRTANA